MWEWCQREWFGDQLQSTVVLEWGNEMRVCVVRSSDEVELQFGIRVWVCPESDPSFMLAPVGLGSRSSVMVTMFCTTQHSGAVRARTWLAGTIWNYVMRR